MSNTISRTSAGVNVKKIPQRARTAFGELDGIIRDLEEMGRGLNLVIAGIENGNSESVDRGLNGLKKLLSKMSKRRRAK